jgi:hypothetical protein
MRLPRESVCVRTFETLVSGKVLGGIVRFPAYSRRVASKTGTDSGVRAGSQTQILGLNIEQV